MKSRRAIYSLVAGIALAGLSPQVLSAEGEARAELMDAEGMSVGEVILRHTPVGTLLHARLRNLPPGAHAFHVHTTGVCEPPFSSSGGHFNPQGKLHGILGPAQQSSDDATPLSQRAVVTARDYTGDEFTLTLYFDFDENGNLVPGTWRAEMAEGHVGDMPNIHVPASGELEIEILNTDLKLDYGLFDADGAAIVIHAGPDDYTSDPAGAAGPRIACGVITSIE